MFTFKCFDNGVSFQNVCFFNALLYVTNKGLTFIHMIMNVSDDLISVASANIEPNVNSSILFTPPSTKSTSTSTSFIGNSINNSDTFSSTMETSAPAKKQNKEVSTLLSVLTLRRYYAESLLDIIRLLSTNELAFRGNWDMDTHQESGLFQAMFEYTMNKDDRLRQAASIIPQNAKYTSPKIQNELITSAVACTQRAIADMINLSMFFALYVDGTKDRNGLECLSIGARYILEDKPMESVISMESCTDLTALGMGKVILHTLMNSEVNVDKLLCQCYNGAFVMSGEMGGVQASITFGRG